MNPDSVSHDPSSVPAAARSSQRAVLVADRLLRTDAATQKVLLDHVSLSLGEGQRVALVGPSGSGKSLLLRSLVRLDPLDSGTLTWKGDRVTDQCVPRFRSQVSYVAQQAHFSSGTVESVLRDPFRFRVHRSGADRFDREQILRWLTQADRDESFLRQPIEQLSGGERQLIALLRTIQFAPAVLLLDEPTAALDQQTTQIAEQWILQWHASDERRAFIWATHDPDQPRRVADTVLSMRDGRWRSRPNEATGPVPGGSPSSLRPQ